MRKKDIKFYLNFKSDSFGVVKIDEVIGFYNVELNLDQKNGGLARDVSFSGSEYQFSFSPNRNHYFEKIMYYFNLYGFESDVELIIQEDGFDDIVFELDFATADTNDYDMFTCNAIQKASLQILKRRREVKVDMFSDRDIDGNYITPLVPKNMLLLSKPVRKYSEWTQTSYLDENFNTIGETTTTYYGVNPCLNIEKSDINSTTMPFEPIIKEFFRAGRNDTIPSDFGSDFQILDLNETAKDITVSIDYDLKLSTDVDNGGDGYTDYSLQLRYGNDFSKAKIITIDSAFLREHKTYEKKQIFNIDIPLLQRTEKVWLFLLFKVRQSAKGMATPKFECFTKLNNMKISISANSISYNTVVPTFRLIDVMKQVVKSTSGLTINANRFDIGGQFYDNVLFNGNLLRNAKKDGKPHPFYISMDDLEKSFTEIRADWEIDSDGKVFFGIEKDYYTDNEVWFFDTVQFSSMKKTSNPIYSLNQFGLKYKSYQSLKEGEELNSADAIHGESMWTFFNKKVENKKDVTIEWVRDPFLLKQQQEKSFEVTDSTATQDDDTLFCVDIVNTQLDQSFQETTTLNHSYNNDKKQLTLTNSGDINFLILGIQVGTLFEIKSPDQNTGFYTVVEVSQTSIVLSRNDSTPMSSSNDGIRPTTYSYTIEKEDIPYTNRTDEEITNIDKLNIGNKFSNLRYSLKRNIVNYYNSFIATANLWWKDKPLLNSVYKNNPDCVFTYEGITTVEGQQFVPNNPILSPFLYEEMVFTNIEHWEWEEIQKRVRSLRGYFRTIDNTGRVIKVYPQKMKYSIGAEKITMVAEEKHEPIDMIIKTNNPNFTSINNLKIKKFEYAFIDDKLNIYDINRQRLFNPVDWFRVSINDYQPKSLYELDNLLKLV